MVGELGEAGDSPTPGAPWGSPAGTVTFLFTDVEGAHEGVAVCSLPRPGAAASVAPETA